MNFLLSCALLAAVVWSSWALPDPEQRQPRQYIIPYAPRHHIVPYSPNPFFRYHSTAPLYTSGMNGLSNLASHGYQPRPVKMPVSPLFKTHHQKKKPEPQEMGIKVGFVYEYDNEDDKGRLFGSFAGATLAKVEDVDTVLNGRVTMTQSLFIPNNQGVATILLDGGFKTNAVYVVTMGNQKGETDADDDQYEEPPLPLADDDRPTQNNANDENVDNIFGEILGAFKVNAGFIPVFKLTAASRFFNVDGNGMSVDKIKILGSTALFSDDAVEDNPDIDARPMKSVKGQNVCVYEYTDTSCNMKIDRQCKVARAGCGHMN